MARHKAVYDRRPVSGRLPERNEVRTPLTKHQGTGSPPQPEAGVHVARHDADMQPRCS